MHAKTVGDDGQRGPFNAKPNISYEFVVSAEGFAVAHLYRPAFPRSSSLIHLRPARVAEADKDAGSVISMTRPRGYFGVGRDNMSLDGVSPPSGLSAGVAGVASAKLKLNETAVRSVTATFNNERIVVRSWPLKENHVVFAEFHY